MALPTGTAPNSNVANQRLQYSTQQKHHRPETALANMSVTPQIKYTGACGWACGVTAMCLNAVSGSWSTVGCEIASPIRTDSTLLPAVWGRISALGEQPLGRMVPEPSFRATTGSHCTIVCVIAVSESRYFCYALVQIPRSSW